MKKGIDVSYCQGRIDFDRIDKNQVQFAIIRSSFGWEKNQKDSQFERNYAGFKKLGIPVGAYHYSYAKTKEQAVKEAKYCLECIRGKSFELPVFLDMEEQSCAAAGRRACTDVAKAFIETMERAGYRSGIYTNPNWLENYLYKAELVGKVNIWLAQWGSSEPYCVRPGSSTMSQSWIPKPALSSASLSALSCAASMYLPFFASARST